MDKKIKEKIKNSFKKGGLGWRITWTTLIFLILFIAIFAPFILVEGANETFSIILLTIFIFAYVFIILIFIWDWLKQKNEDKNKK